MDKSLRDRVEEVLDIHVRPSLRTHLGDVTVTGIEAGVLHVEVVGKCVGCPSAELSMTSFVADEVTGRVPEISDVVLVSGVSDALIGEARRLLSLRVRTAA